MDDEVIERAIRDNDELRRCFRTTVLGLIERHGGDLDYTAFRVSLKLAYRLHKEED